MKTVSEAKHKKALKQIEDLETENNRLTVAVRQLKRKLQAANITIARTNHGRQ